MTAFPLSPALRRIWASDAATAAAVVVAAVALGMALYPVGTRLLLGFLPPLVLLALLVVFSYRRVSALPTRARALGIWLVSFWLVTQVFVEIDLLRQLAPDVSVWGTIDEARCDFSYGEAIFRLNASRTHLGADWHATPVRPEDRAARGWVGSRCPPSEAWRRVVDEVASTPGHFYRVLPDRVVLVSPARGIAAALYTD